MPLRIHLPNARRTAQALPLAGTVLACLALLASPMPVAAAPVLHSPAVSPADGTTDTVFVMSVTYVSTPEARPATSVAVEIVGLGGASLPMGLASGTATDGRWETSTMLPAGSWDLVFHATTNPSSQSPDSIDGPVVNVTPAPTVEPTLSPTPHVTVGPTPVPTPGATETESPPPGATPTVAPAPLPPGATPGPTVAPALLPPGATPRPTSAGEPVAVASPTGSDAASPVASVSGSGAAAASSSSPAALESAAPAISPGQRSGFGRIGWVVVGGMTSVAGAALLARQWLGRRGLRV